MPQLFLSTPSARRATQSAHEHNTVVLDFYPRPPRGGRPNVCRQFAVPEDFYPRPPRGGRPSTASVNVSVKSFLSTPSARRATPVSAGALVLAEPISIHALREEGDEWLKSNATPVQNFYPRPPRGGRHNPYFTQRADVVFLSTPSARRATLPFFGR